MVQMMLFLNKFVKEQNLLHHVWRHFLHHVWRHAGVQMIHDQPRRAKQTFTRDAGRMNDQDESRYWGQGSSG